MNAPRDVRFPPLSLRPLPTHCGHLITSYGLGMTTGYGDRSSAAKHDLIYGVASAAIVCGGSYLVSLLSEGMFPYMLAIMTLYSCGIILRSARSIGMAHAATRLFVVALLSIGFFAVIEVISR